MFEKFLSLFMKRNAVKRRITMPEPPAEEFTTLAQWAREQVQCTMPFATRTPHSRMHELITRGQPDALIAAELGVEIAAVRNYRDIIGAKGRHAARQRAAEARVPAMLTRGDLDEDIAAALGLIALPYGSGAEHGTVAPSPDVSSGGGDFGGGGASGTY